MAHEGVGFEPGLVVRPSRTDVVLRGVTRATVAGRL